ncbi:hypothetical protein PPUJ20066_32610 [Pseudomonas putida]|nr:hypothetical protein PPUJ20066_32610 [Pseudomonas putida]
MIDAAAGDDRRACRGQRTRLTGTLGAPAGIAGAPAGGYFGVPCTTPAVLSKRLLVAVWM